MFGAGDGQRKFNVPVICDVTSDAVNDALQGLAGQLNDIVSPILKNFDPDTGKQVKIRCGSAAKQTTTCDDPLNWTSDVSAALESGRAWSAIGIAPDKSYLYGTRNLHKRKTIIFDF